MVRGCEASRQARVACFLSSGTSLSDLALVPWVCSQKADTTFMDVDDVKGRNEFTTVPVKGGRFGLREPEVCDIKPTTETCFRC